MNGHTNLRGKFRLATLALLVIGLLAVVAPFALAAGDAPAAATTKRPLAEFVAAQGTYCFDDGLGGCILFEPPVLNFLGQNDPARGLSMSVDYAGLADKWIVENGGDSIGVKFTGTVTEKAMPDGRAKVTVVLNTKKALVWVEDSPDFSGPLLFGNKAPEVLAGAKAATCNSALRVTFINTAPGAPMPDLIQLAIFPEPGQELLSITTHCNARGQLHAAYGVTEGTPGRAISHQVARVIDGSLTFTTEKVILKVLH